MLARVEAILPRMKPNSSFPNTITREAYSISWTLVADRSPYPTGEESKLVHTTNYFSLLVKHTRNHTSSSHGGDSPVQGVAVVISI